MQSDEQMLAELAAWNEWQRNQAIECEHSDWPYGKQLDRLLALARAGLEAQAREQRLREALEDALSNHTLAAGIIAGVASKYNRPDLGVHAARMLSGIEKNRAALSETKDAPAAEENSDDFW